MTALPLPPLPAYVTNIAEVVRLALAEDIGSGDVTAHLVAGGEPAHARVISRERAIFCGRPWAEEVFRQIDPTITLEWPVAEGGEVAENDAVLHLKGPARALLTGERSALNFLQTLSGTATRVRYYVAAVAGTAARIVDTRKTLPGLRNAQKYAVLCGGGINHRIGLYDGILIKENHIAAAGGIAAAIRAARALHAGVPLMTEAENLQEAQAALAADVDLLLVDDFPLDELRTAVERTRAHRANGGHTLIEYSGGTTLERVRAIAETGVDRISIGAITKHVHAVDLSMRLQKGEA
ncbi:MAG: carboxylating nicotinate-nucleotide diphosphorylase [Nevskiaceae bacterium]|nr:MAG: carboxylating nicotinate-nucleotide diphosphorylase [Nevskiaceae bacterium]TBR71756.1 MAG: carboxylating nicotinate-nucleotide diphosphorylase [Nevskiaceae bacterium]